MGDPLNDIDILDFIALRPHCEVEGRKCTRKTEQRHHGLFRRSKRFPELNVLINYQATCANCHTGTGEADAYENKVRFYEMQKERYGDLVDEWIDGLPMKDKRL